MESKAGNMVMTVLMVVYILSPLDFVPDVIPIIGWIDDVVAAAIGTQQFVSMLNK